MSLAAQCQPSASELIQSRHYCAQLTKNQARNFYYGLKLLPRPKRQAMFALYAYMRLVDDIADGDDGSSAPQRGAALDAWARATAEALSGQFPREEHRLWPAFVEMVQQRGVPHRVFHDVIEGQRQDLQGPQFQHFDELRQYCYRVAGVVGVASIHVWGFEGGAKTIDLAVDRGIAFQLTNILRDLREDAGRGRTYLPREELDAAGIQQQDLRDGRGGEPFAAFLLGQIQRVQSYYDKSSPLEDLISPDCRPTLRAMTEIYHGLLEKMAADPGQVLQRRVSLSALSKVRIAWNAARSARAARGSNGAAPSTASR